MSDLFSILENLIKKNQSFSFEVRQRGRYTNAYSASCSLSHRVESAIFCPSEVLEYNDSVVCAEFSFPVSPGENDQNLLSYYINTNLPYRASMVTPVESKRSDKAYVRRPYLPLDYFSAQLEFLSKLKSKGNEVAKSLISSEEWSSDSAYLIFKKMTIKNCLGIEKFLKSNMALSKTYSRGRF